MKAWKTKSVKVEIDDSAREISRNRESENFKKMFSQNPSLAVRSEHLLMGGSEV